MADEPSLLERIKRHDQQALAEVHDRYFNQIYHYINYRLGDSDTAADLAGEVFLALIKALKKGKPPKTSLSGWLYAVARNLTADHIRQKVTTVPLIEDLEADTPSLTDQIYIAQLTPTLKQCILELTDEQQHVIALRFGQGLSLADTAEIMDKSVGAVKALQHRALASLARLMPLEVQQDG
ncbi:MAG: sigma-70 family RNA polymerase sigma factor [Anaerolineae bacterium]|nr:sigma-70 family RNA polymerase sigma factor [Anaerolineae bacterium]